MKLKRIAAMLTVAVMAVSLAACGGNTGTNTESSQNPKENAEAQAVHLNLAESWGFEYFYTIITPEVSSRFCSISSSFQLPTSLVTSISVALSTTTPWVSASVNLVIGLVIMNVCF